MKMQIRRERFMERLVRVFRQAGYAPACILTISPLELAEIENMAPFASMGTRSWRKR